MTNLYRECGWCGEALDENCNAVGKYRKEIGVVITSGICRKCEEKYFPEEAYADTLRSEDLNTTYERDKEQEETAPNSKDR